MRIPIYVICQNIIHVSFLENMKAALIFFIIVAVQYGSAQKQYTNKFDNVDVDGVLSNNRILTNYIKCLMDKGPCTQEGRELKSKYYLLNMHMFVNI